MYKRIITAAVVVSVFFLSSSSWGWGGHSGYHHGHGSEYGIPILAEALGVVTGALLGSAVSCPAPQLAPTYALPPGDSYQYGYSSGYDAGVREGRRKRYQDAWQDGHAEGVQAGETGK